MNIQKKRIKKLLRMFLFFGPLHTKIYAFFRPWYVDCTIAIVAYCEAIDQCCVNCALLP